METTLRSINDTNTAADTTPITSHLINDRDDDQQNQNDFMYYTNNPLPQPPEPQPRSQPNIYYQDKTDFFTNLDKTAYVVIFVAFILGFFMGKAMQPVILRHG